MNLMCCLSSNISFFNRLISEAFNKFGKPFHWAWSTHSFQTCGNKQPHLLCFIHVSLSNWHAVRSSLTFFALFISLGKSCLLLIWISAHPAPSNHSFNINLCPSSSIKSFKHASNLLISNFCNFVISGVHAIFFLKSITSSCLHSSISLWKDNLYNGGLTHSSKPLQNSPHM